MSEIFEAKARLRNAALSRRAALSPADRQDGSARAISRIRPRLREGDVVAMFLPIRGEIDPLGLSPDIAALGGVVVLPAVEGRLLRFRRYTGSEELEPGPLGTRHPPAGAEALLPDLVVAPLAAFDRRGGRIGYGGGYYDRTLASLAAGGHPFRAIGIAFSCQEVASVPMEPHDVPLLAIATEEEFIEIREPL